jgi:AcrR family transcriptional regulator
VRYTGSTAGTGVRRERNRRGEGSRLRGELIEAGVAMVEAQGAEALSLRSLAREVGIAATSIYLHFTDLGEFRAALVQRCFEQLTEAAGAAASGSDDPADALRARCRAYCRFAVGHPNLYQLMFGAPLPPAPLGDPASTPGRRSFENLVIAVDVCLRAGPAGRHDDPFRLASLIWSAEHGIAMTRIFRPMFPWAPLDELVEEMVDRLMGFGPAGQRTER